MYAQHSKFDIDTLTRNFKIFSGQHLDEFLT